MADKLAELRVALKGLSCEGLLLIAEFAKFLVKQQGKKKTG
ncbi:hypothetical protein ES703_60962 [subsurface metagenome]